LANTLLMTGEIPEIRWQHGDDNCECMFQRIGWWTNPYLGRTMEIRLCCAWAKLIELHPELAEFYREIPAFDNCNTGQYETEPHEWNGEYDMPRALWHRQLSVQTGKPVDQVRRDYDHLEAPKAVPKPRPISLLIDYLQRSAGQDGLDINITDIQ